MTDTPGAITQAIEALDIAGFNATTMGNIEDVITIMNALEALKAFKDGPAPCVTGLTLGSDLEGKISETDAVKLVNSVMASLWEIMMGKAEKVDNIDGNIETKHLQDVIK